VTGFKTFNPGSPGHWANTLELSAGEEVALVTLDSGPGNRAWINLTAEQLHGLAYYATAIANELDEKEEAAV
jgi:hypothetical protein